MDVRLEFAGSVVGHTLVWSELVPFRCYTEAYGFIVMNGKS
jgi:hypothetical protein